ncbi:hypothetical protein ABT187_13830 [Streptomyces sp. NPDC001817]|uniref:hypothetical protein n=1 Tax=Streptomyces sp. NPDC001817 TaxID=3154398 RepID=UPI0033290975
MDSEDHVCPVCGQPVGKVVGRRKTLGAWVPVWGPGPCRNPGCAACREPAEPTVPADGTGHPRSGESAAGKP